MLLQLISRKKIIAKENERIHYSITKRDRSCNKVKLFSFLRQALTIVTKKSDDQKKEKTN